MAPGVMATTPTRKSAHIAVAPGNKLALNVAVVGKSKISKYGLQVEPS